ncbi:hypothetical protein [Dysgonomonas sp. 520]|nr:hypothetical protein [Dysgonomonas sp. 520]
MAKKQNNVTGFTIFFDFEEWRISVTSVTYQVTDVMCFRNVI